MFVNFLGGSIASAALNATQPFVVTAPYLSQWGGGLEVGKGSGSADQDGAEISGIGGGDEARHGRGRDRAARNSQPVRRVRQRADGSSAYPGRCANRRPPWSAALGAAFAAAESFNRQAAFIALGTAPTRT